jgi:predicted lipoprotein with Yx(FWY)xxD motif
MGTGDIAGSAPLGVPHRDGGPVKLPSSRNSIAIAALIILGTAASACGSDDNSSNATTPPASAPAATQAPAASGATVMTSQSSLGTILVDGDGMTLYMFMPDKAGPSTCEGECLATWPALTGPATAGTGADQSLLATATRADDGTAQVTYNGWPLYHYAADKAAGDVNGQGVKDIWYVVDPTGKAIDDD